MPSKLTSTALITVFGVDLAGCITGGDRVPYAILLTIVGLLAIAYSVVSEHYAGVPRLRLWVVLLLITWLAIGYDYYDRHYGYGYNPGRAWDDSRPLERLNDLPNPPNRLNH